MSIKVLPLVVALASGILMAVQGSINARFGKVVGLWEALLIIQMVGVATVTVGLFILGLGSGKQGFASLGSAPWYSYLGGFFGVLIIYAVAVSIPKVGVAVATTAIIVGQVSSALIIDHFGFFGLQKVPFVWLKVVGLALLAAGAKLVLG